MNKKVVIIVLIVVVVIAIGIYFYTRDNEGIEQKSNNDANSGYIPNTNTGYLGFTPRDLSNPREPISSSGLL